MSLYIACQIIAVFLTACSMGAMGYALVATESAEMRAILAIPALEVFLIVICIAFILIVILSEKVSIRFRMSRVTFTNNNSEQQWNTESDDSSLSTMARVRVALRALLLRPVPANDSKVKEDGDCPICLENLRGDDNIAIWYDGSSLAINVVNEPLAKCRCCMNVMHTTCLCDTFVNTALSKAEEGYSQISKDCLACPLCRAAWV